MIMTYTLIIKSNVSWEHPRVPQFTVQLAVQNCKALTSTAVVWHDGMFSKSVILRKISHYFEEVRTIFLLPERIHYIVAIAASAEIQSVCMVLLRMSVCHVNSIV